MTNKLLVQVAGTFIERKLGPEAKEEFAKEIYIARKTQTKTKSPELEM